MAKRAIRELLDVKDRPRVVRLEHLEGHDPSWITSSYCTTDEVGGHLRALCRALEQPAGTGLFLVGPYGSGKSHFIAYVTQNLRAGRLVDQAPDVVAASLVNFRADTALEDVVAGALGLESAPSNGASGASGGSGVGDRRPAFEAMQRAHPNGLLLILDELSEFLRSKPDRQSFTEDVRFLQFLGEWCQGHRCFVLCALQEQIEHTGDLEHGLYRKIRDRYPLRMFLTPAHVRDLVRDGILCKKPGYEEAAQRTADEVARALPDCGAYGVDTALLSDFYPIHPATLDLLDEVRDCFSQTRGAVDFVVTQLLGDPARNVAPFLDRPWGELLGPDRIVEHFRDLLELQPEHLDLAQRLFPSYQKLLPELFETEPLRKLARQLVNLLVLVHLSPTRETLSARQATAWLLYRAARIEPERNLALVEKVLRRLKDHGRHVVAQGDGYRLDFSDSDLERLERRLRREADECAAMGEAVFEELAPLLAGRDFGPFSLPKERLQHRSLRWHGHERRYAVYFGEGAPEAAEAAEVPVLVIRPCWGGGQAAASAHTLLPASLAPEERHFELLALFRLKDGAWSEAAKRRIAARLEQQTLAFETEVKTAYGAGSLIDPSGRALPAPAADARAQEGWLDQLAKLVLARLYPGFERFAPSFGPLSKDILRRFASFCVSNDLAAPSSDDAVQLVREAYLIPMEVIARQGGGYVIPANLERRELIKLLLPLLEHQPVPKAVYEHLAQPIYGLVPDQVHVLLLALLSLGELDLVRDGKSYRELFELLLLPIQYHRVVAGKSLSSEALLDLVRLLDAFQLKQPAKWHAIAERREIRRVREAARRLEATLEPLLFRLGEDPRGQALGERLKELILPWRTFDRDGDELEAFERLRGEVGPIEAFAARLRSAEQLPGRLDRLMRESERLEHLFRTMPREAGPGGVELPAIPFEHPGDAPPLDDLIALQNWIGAAQSSYAAYQQRYIERHDAFWRAQEEHPAWSWAPPAMAQSRHLQLGREIDELSRAQDQIRRLRCRGRPDLTFQSTCSCGFDGKRAAIDDELKRRAAAKERIDSALKSFFQQETVRERVGLLVKEGLESGEQIRLYLEGQQPLPQIEDIARFDRHLSGVALIQPLPAGDLLSRIEGKTWAREELLNAVRTFLDERAGQAERVRLERGAPGQAEEEVARFCLSQCLRHGVALPRGLGSEALLQAVESVLPADVGAGALLRLDRMHLPETLIDKLLSWAIDGVLELPKPAQHESELLTAAREVARPVSPSGPAELARLAAALYAADPRLRRIGGERWDARLDALANSPLAESPPDLASVLAEHAEEAWLLIDAFGLPLFARLEDELGDALGGRRIESVRFARAPADTTTDACYRHLAEAGLARELVKINVLDALLHERRDPFDDLARIAAAELRGAYRRVAGRFDPSRPLMVFADHGFRLARDGRGYGHGGSSTLERVVPVIRLMPIPVDPRGPV